MTILNQFAERPGGQRVREKQDGRGVKIYAGRLATTATATLGPSHQLWAPHCPPRALIVSLDSLGKHLGAKRAKGADRTTSLNSGQPATAGSL